MVFIVKWLIANNENNKKHKGNEFHSTFRLLSTTEGPFADTVDQDQTARSVQNGLESTLFDNEMF